MNNSFLFAHFRPKSCVGIYVGVMSAPPTQEAFERGLVSAKTTLVDTTPTLEGEITVTGRFLVWSILMFCKGR